MIIEATDYDAVDRGETDFEHYFCSIECAEEAGFEENDTRELKAEEINDTDEYVCEFCGQVIEK